MNDKIKEKVRDINTANKFNSQIERRIASFHETRNPNMRGVYSKFVRDSKNISALLLKLIKSSSKLIKNIR